MKKQDFFAIPKNALKNETNAAKLTFLIVFGLCFVLTFIMAMITNGVTFSVKFFGTGRFSDTFMDFMNSIRDSSQVNMYRTRWTIYPPLAALFFRFIGGMMSLTSVHKSFSGRKELLIDTLAMLSFMLFAILCVYLIFKMLDYRMQSEKKSLLAKLCAFCLAFSYPVVYCLERGNITILCVVTAMFFVFFRNSNNKFIRELALIALAISAGLKFYPAIFGLILLAEKKFFAAFRCIIYGLICFFGPIIIINAMDTAILSSPSSNNEYFENNATSISYMVSRLIKNLINTVKNKAAISNYSYVSIQQIFMLAPIKKLLQGYDIPKICSLAIIISEVIAGVGFFITKEEWKRVFLLIYIILNIPIASSVYALSFIIIPFAIYLYEKRSFKSADWFSLLLMSILTSFIPIFTTLDPKSIQLLPEVFGNTIDICPQKLIAAIVFQTLFFTVMISSISSLTEKIIEIRKQRKQRREV